jgi:uncharacterized protein GlcG (DUF336 family)
MKKVLIVVLLVCFTGIVHAEDESPVFERKMITPEAAYTAANAAMLSCRKAGYQVAVSVVDASGVPVVFLRDRLAGFHTVHIAKGKARASVSFKSSTLDLMNMTKSDAPEAAIRLTPGITVIPGGLMIEAGGSLIGGIGVSGAPGGDLDEACARDGIAAIQEALDFE